VENGNKLPALEKVQQSNNIQLPQPVNIYGISLLSLPN